MNNEPENKPKTKNEVETMRGWNAICKGIFAKSHG